MISLFFVPLSFLILGASGREHSIELWEHRDFTGVGITVVNRKKTGALEYCNNLGREWWDRITSVKPMGNCYEIYNSVNCQGTVHYMFPGGPGLKNLEELDFNDQMRSFRLCELDEEATSYPEERPSTLSRRSLNPNRPELGFWKAFFAAYSAGFLNAFLRRANGNYFINWDFIPQVTGSKGVQYQSTLEWLMDVIAGRILTLSAMRSLRSQAEEVRSDRAQLNQQHASTSTGRQWAVHVQLENIWGQIVDAFDTAIRDAEGEYDDYL